MTQTIYIHNDKDLVTDTILLPLDTEDSGVLFLDCDLSFFNNRSISEGLACTFWYNISNNGIQHLYKENVSKATYFVLTKIGDRKPDKFCYSMRLYQIKFNRHVPHKSSEASDVVRISGELVKEEEVILALDNGELSVFSILNGNPIKINLLTTMISPMITPIWRQIYNNKWSDTPAIGCFVTNLTSDPQKTLLKMAQSN